MKSHHRKTPTFNDGTIRHTDGCPQHGICNRTVIDHDELAGTSSLGFSRAACEAGQAYMAALFIKRDQRVGCCLQNRCRSGDGALFGQVK